VWAVACHLETLPVAVVGVVGEAKGVGDYHFAALARASRLRDVRCPRCDGGRRELRQQQDGYNNYKLSAHLPSLAIAGGVATAST
jgi:hypothetical protein